MCGVAEASLAMSALGAVSGFISGKQQAAIEKSQGEYYAAQNRNNAIRAQQEADAVEAQGESDARDRYIKGELSKGNIRTSLAANGIVVDEDSGLDSLLDESRTTDLDVLTIRSNAANKAQALRYEADTLNVDAKNSIVAGNFKAKQSTTKAFGTLLTGAAKTGASYSKFQKSGAL